MTRSEAMFHLAAEIANYVKAIESSSFSPKYGK
jgi:hypothetical protein